MKKVEKRDWGYVPVEPDADFDPKRNQRVIDDVISQNEKIRARKNRDFKRSSGERVSAVASYVKHVDKTKSDMTVEQFFGRRYLAYLRGRQIVDRLRDAKEKSQGQAQKI